LWISVSGFFQKVQLNDQAARYLQWWQHGAYSVNGRCFDIGNTTAAALRRFERLGDATTSGDFAERASGNGSIMRLAPVPIRHTSLFPDNVERLAKLCIESSLPTHASPQCLSACAYFGLILCGLMQGLERDQVLSPHWDPLRMLRQFHSLHAEVAEVAEGSFRKRKPPQIKGSGYVVQSLEAALWAFHDATDFREAVLRAVNLGDDADTTGAVCGQLAGAYWGETGIPQEWRDSLARKDMIEQAIDGLLEPSASNEAAGTAFAANESSVAPVQRTDESEAMFQLTQGLDAPPTASSYWVIPCRLLAGAYPGNPDPVKHGERVRAFFDAGVRTFVNLMQQDEVDHQGNPFVPYLDDVEKSLPDATCQRFPIRDLSVPSISDMTAILDAIDESLAANRCVYVHCWGGVGRTGTVIGCWLLRHGLATTENVLHVLKQLRQQDQERGYRDSPETSDQRRFMLAWPDEKRGAG
jgi:ADP-ribosyl-[dinitrogen reductase] hydrolase